VLIARLPLGRFLKAVAEPATIAFATSTSERPCPRHGIHGRVWRAREIVAFVIPAATASIWTARHSICHGFDFCGAGRGHPHELDAATLHGFALMLTSKGVAGVPRAVLVVLLATAATFHLPPNRSSSFSALMP